MIVHRNTTPASLEPAMADNVDKITKGSGRQLNDLLYIYPDAGFGVYEEVSVDFRLDEKKKRPKLQ
jgi:hypothetical protein